MLVGQDGDAAYVPQDGDAEQLQAELSRRLYLGYLEEGDDRVDCYCGELSPDVALPAGMRASGLRLLYPLLGDDMVAIAGRAAQVVAWDRTHRFCGQCATPTEAMEGERARRCPQCGLLNYPRISPAIIIAVVRQGEGGRELLLAAQSPLPVRPVQRAGRLCGAGRIARGVRVPGGG